MANETRKTEAPPYIAFSTFFSYIKGLEKAGIPDRIDKSLLRNMSGGNQSALLSSLRWFGLIDSDGAHGASLEALVRAGEGAGTVLREMLPKAYKFMADGSIPLDRATGAQVEEKFKAYGLTGSTVAKAMAFFIAACKEAAIPLSAHIKLPKVAKANGVLKAKKARQAAADEAAGVDDAGDGGGNRSTELGLDPLLVALLQKIPAQGEQWPQDKRLRWFKTFAMNVSQVYDDDDEPVELTIDVKKDSERANGP